MWSSNNELAGWIDVIDDIVIKKAVVVVVVVVVVAVGLTHLVLFLP